MTTHTSGARGTSEAMWGTPESVRAALPNLAADDVEAVCRVGRGALTPHTAGKLFRHCLTNIDARPALDLIQALSVSTQIGPSVLM